MMPAGQRERARRIEQLRADLAADVGALADARHRPSPPATEISSAGICATERVAHAQQDVAVGGLAGRHVVRDHAEQEAADDVDEEDQQARDRVAAHVLAGTVHRAEELGLLADLGAALLGLLLVDQAGVQVGVDRHLLAGHRVEREARADFGDALGALGDDDEVDDHQDREDDQADGEVAADQEVAEGFDHLAGGAGAGVAVEQHDAGRRDVQRQAQAVSSPAARREGREVEAAAPCWPRPSSPSAPSRC
jgi:hypothetical protein